MISKTPLDDITKLNKICASAQIGWWEVNFTTEQCLISETLLKALGAKSELLSIDELVSTIRQPRLSQTHCGRVFIYPQKRSIRTDLSRIFQAW